MNLILIRQDELVAKLTARLGDHRAHHIRAVLRAAPGDTVRIGLLDGPRGVGTVRAVSAETVELACAFDAVIPPRPRVDLLLALPRPKVMKRLWAQLAALGVGRILLTNAARVERNYFDTHVIDPAFFTPFLIEGLQQARDTRLPLVTLHRLFKPMLEDELDALSGAAERIALQPGAARPLVAEAPRRAGARALIAIGPEGGWTPYELDRLAGRGFRPAHLGSRALRSDTACIAALAVLHAAFDFAGELVE